MDLLISVAELRRDLDRGRAPVLLDVRWSLIGPPGRELYDAGHLPGAHFVDVDSDLADPPGPGGRHPMPDPERFVGAMRRCGVSLGRPVVCYDAADSTSAARAWWLLRYFGHDNVSILDGGYRAWVEAGEDVTQAEPPPEHGDFEPRPGGLPLLDAAGAARVARQGVLLDARSAIRYHGEQEPIDPVAGHIPGAVSADTLDNVQPDGRFKDAATLARRFAELGADGDAPVGAYCGSGVTAAHEVFALAIAGISAGLYVGSWSNWIADPKRPVATGMEPG